MDQTRTLLIGTYGETGVRRVRAQGDRRTASGSIAGTAEASFALWSPRHGRLYVVREESEGAIDIIAPGEDWRWLDRVGTGGAEPCHCALDETESFLAVANYGSGSLTVFALDPNGSPLADPWTYQASGSGPDRDRQEGPHAHWVGFTPDQRWLIQTDLGADEVRAFAFDPVTGVTGAPAIAFSAPPGSGPRWMALGLTGERALLVSELDSSLSLLSFADGRFSEIDRRRTLSREQGDNLGGHLAYDPAAGRAYVTNRGDDSIATFAVRDGGLELLGTVPSGGTSPRFAYIDRERRQLLVAHEEDGPVTVFDLGPDGQPAPTGETIDAQSGAWIGEVNF